MKISFSNKKVKFFLKLLVTLGFSAWVVLSVNWKEVIADISEIKFWQVIVYVVIVLLGMAVSSYKWQIISAVKNLNFSFFHFFKLYITGTFINNFAPSFIGGDAYKAYEIGKSEKKYVEAASTVVFDRITGLLGATILALFFSFLNFEKIIQNKVLLIANIAVFLSFLIDIFIFIAKRFSFWGKISNHLPHRFVEFMQELNGYGTNPGIFKKSILLSLVFNTIGIALANYVLFWAMGTDIGIMDYLSIIFLISIISSIPISINNIGIKEWAYISFFGALGISTSSVVSVALLSRFLQMIISLLAVPVYFKGKNV